MIDPLFIKVFAGSFGLAVAWSILLAARHIQLSNRRPRQFTDAQLRSMLH